MNFKIKRTFFAAAFLAGFAWANEDKSDLEVQEPDPTEVIESIKNDITGPAIKP